MKSKWRWAIGILLVAMATFGGWRVLRGDVSEQNPLLSLESDPGALREADVEERIRAGSYSYLRLVSGDTVRWAAVLGQGVAEGTRVAVTHFGTRRDFHSRRLDRTFDRLDFVSVTPIEKD